MLWRRGDRLFAGHGGAMPGHRAAIAHHRESGLALAFAANGSTGDASARPSAASPPRNAAGWQGRHRAGSRRR